MVKTMAAVSPCAVNEARICDWSEADHDTSSRFSTDGSQTHSMFTRPAAERAMSGPEALMKGTSPKSFQLIAPRLSTKRSLPRIVNAPIRTDACQMKPRFQRITSSAEKGYQRLD